MTKAIQDSAGVKELPSIEATGRVLEPLKPAAIEKMWLCLLTLALIRILKMGMSLKSAMQHQEKSVTPKL